ncbi:ribbon-helix-helix protein, CopG family [Candidatus Parcubacteria bacterium]|nr:ribbon-helix-helix protein, CopG family [Candidatus Parcubacteria bacterium]
MLRTTKLITISILPDLLKKAEKLAKEEDRTKSELFREALRMYIKERTQQKNLKAFSQSLEKMRANVKKADSIEVSQAIEEAVKTVRKSSFRQN